MGNSLPDLEHVPVLAQGFRTAEEVQRFSDMMDEMCYIVATKHSGSLKARPLAVTGCSTSYASLLYWTGVKYARRV